MTLGDAAEPLVHSKIVSLFGVGLVQMLVFLAPVAAGYLFFRDSLALPDMDLSILVFEPGQMITGALILRLAVHLFRYGSIEYGKKLSIAGTFHRKELAAK